MNEVETVIPFALADVYWDYTILEETEEKKYVLFGAIIKETADKYIKLFESIGLKPCLCGIEAESLKYAIIKELTDGKDTLVIDLNTLSTNYLIIKGSAIKYFFSSNDGGKALIHKLSSESTIPENIILEEKEKNIFRKTYLPTINKFIEKYYKLGKKIIQEQQKNDPSIKIETIFLAGEFLNLPNLYKIIEEYFPDKKIQFVNPGNFLTVNATKFLILNVDLIPYSTYFTHSLGIALRGLIGKSNDGINLLPDTLRAKIRNRKTAFILACISVILSILALFIASFIFFKQLEISYTRKALEIKKASIENLLYGTRYQDIRDAINQFNKEVLELSVIDNSLFSVPMVLQTIQDKLPEETIKITEIRFVDSDSTFELTGIAKNRDDLLSVVENLKKIDFIDEVTIPISNYGEKYDSSFILKIKLNYKKLPKYGS